MAETSKAAPQRTQRVVLLTQRALDLYRGHPDDMLRAHGIHPFWHSRTRMPRHPGDTRLDIVWRYVTPPEL